MTGRTRREFARELHHGYTALANDASRAVIEKVEDAASDPSDATDATSPDADLDAVHAQDFLRGVRAGTPVSSPIEEGHKSVLLAPWATSPGVPAAPSTRIPARAGSSGTRRRWSCGTATTSPAGSRACRPLGPP